MKYNTQVGIHSHYNIYNKANAIFDPKSYVHGENLEYPSVLLKKELSKLGVDINTLDVHPIEEYRSILFIDMPSLSTLPGGKTIEQLHKMGKKLYLFINESKLTIPDNWDKDKHRYFEKVFTWHAPLVDGKKYIKFYLPNKMPAITKFALTNRTGLCTMIAGNHNSSDPRELYGERRKIIRWFENNHPQDFDLYGRGWDSEIFRRPSVSLPVKFLCLFKPFRIKLDKEYYPSYKGEVKSKRDTFSKYRFSICYENARDIDGYITEKIFDCLFAGTIPIYLGAPNIKDFVPENAFIDKRRFNTHEDLYAFIKGLPEEEYMGYIENIEEFIKSDMMYKFSADNYVNTIIKECIN